MTTVQKTDIAKNVVLGSTSITVTRKPFSTISGPTKGQDIICFVGFCPNIGTRYQMIPVESLEQILAILAGDLSNEDNVNAVKDSSIYQSLVSSWAVGGRNAIIMRLGDTDELVDLTDDEKYQLIYDRLAVAYPLITDNEYIQYVVPIDAIAEGYTKENSSFLDFLKQAAFAMAKAINLGTFQQAIISTASSSVTILKNAESIRQKEDWQFRDPAQSYCYSSDLGWLPNNDAYRFVAVPAGRALFSYPEYDVSFEGGLAPAFAGLSAWLPYDVSSMGRILHGVRLFNPLSKDDADILSLAGYIPLGETARQ